MQSFHLSFEYSAWWLLPIVLVSAGLAWWMYSGKNVWTKRTRQVLTVLRFLVLALVLVLLLSPHFTFIRSYKEKPLFPVLVDNSSSIPLGIKNVAAIKETVAAIQKKLIDKGYEAPILTFENRLSKSDSIQFTFESSDLAKLLAKGEKSIATLKDGHLVFLSDGIFNVGISPEYQSYKPKIYSLGMGDTLARKDLVLKSVQNNSVAFLGNKFLLRTEIKSIGFSGKEVEVVLKGSKGNVIDKQKTRVQGENWHQHLDFTVTATEKGYQRYSLEIVPLEGESNLLNNKLSAYIDVVDDRENVLLISLSPHPNIKAIRSALGTLENIHLDVYIPGFEVPKPTTYDLVILHNCLLSTIGEAKKYIKDNTPIWYIAGSQLNYSAFNPENGIVEIDHRQQSDQVQGALNANFSKFKLNEETAKLLSKLPPTEVVFGDIKAKPGTELLLYQQVSGVVSSKPLLLFGQSSRKTGALLTDGLWLWKMYEAQTNGNSLLLDELIVKSVQYLSGKEDKRKFRIYPHQKEYYEGESPLIEVELFNDLYEKVYGQKTVFQFQSSNGKKTRFDFVPTEGSAAFAAPSLSPGVYKVSAQTEYGGKQLTAQAEFIVKERQLEALDLQANYQLLRQVSTKSKGAFFPWSQKENLLKKLEEMEATPIWKSEEKDSELIDEKWYYFLIVALIVAEWVIRRYTGGY